MKKSLVPLGAALLVLAVTGCETDNAISARIQEKSAAYANLSLREKTFIARGAVSTGFTPDMVYMAVGSPSKVAPVRFPEGGQGEIWTYQNFYPAFDGGNMRYTSPTTESVYQPAQFVNNPYTSQADYDGEEYSISGGPTRTPLGMSRTPGSIAATGGPQGGSMEPADLQAYTLQVFIADGKVSAISLQPN